MFGTLLETTGTVEDSNQNMDVDTPVVDFNDQIIVEREDLTCKEYAINFKSMKTLKKHMKLPNHGIKTKKNKCEVCLKFFFDKATLNKHKKTVHKPKELEPKISACDECDSQFLNKSSLNRHTDRSVHDHEGEQNCPDDIG